MAEFKSITAEELTANTFRLIGKDWGLVTAGTKEKVNTMTVSWGGLGIMWGKPVAYIFIRPQRYTKEFIDNNTTLSLSFYGENYREMLSFMGSKSGKEVDKIKEMNLSLTFKDSIPYFEEATTVLCLKKLYHQEMEASAFDDIECDQKWYANKDYHTMYVCEITDILTK